MSELRLWLTALAVAAFMIGVACWPGTKSKEWKR